MLASLAALTLFSAGGSFQFKGMYVEGCSCTNACAYELKGENPGCTAAGFFSFDSGTYAGKSLAGTRVAYAAGADWYRLYVDGPDARRREVAAQLVSAAFKDFGKPESVAHVPISVTGSDGKYVAKVRSGQVLMLRTEPVRALGSKKALTYSNIYGSTLHPEIMQAKTVKCTFKDGKRSLEFAGSNGFFNSRIRTSGKL